MLVCWQRRSGQRDQQSNLSPLLPLPTKFWATSKTNTVGRRSEVETWRVPYTAELGVETMLSKTVDPDELPTMDSLLT